MHNLPIHLSPPLYPEVVFTLIFPLKEFKKKSLLKIYKSWTKPTSYKVNRNTTKMYLKQKKNLKMRKKDKAVYFTHLIKEISLYYDYCWLFDKLLVFVVFCKSAKFMKVSSAIQESIVNYTTEIKTLEKYKNMLCIYIERERERERETFCWFFLENV